MQMQVYRQMDKDGHIDVVFRCFGVRASLCGTRRSNFSSSRGRSVPMSSLSFVVLAGMSLSPRVHTLDIIYLYDEFSEGFQPRYLLKQGFWG